MASAENHNEIVSRLIKSIGADVLTHGKFAEQMVVLESLTAGLLLASAIKNNRQPDELVAAFTEGVRERLHKMVYGEGRH